MTSTAYESHSLSKQKEPSDISFDPFKPQAIFQQALELHYNCEADGDETHSRLMFRNLVKSTLGFEELSRRTNINSKSLHRMLGENGNPTSKNMATIVCCLRKYLDLSIAVQVVPNEEE